VRIGSLFSGYGGLDSAALNVFGGRVAWVSDIDPGACKILDHHWPDVPNLGDITAVDWDSVEPVDVITAGFPCQDVSAAGKRAGLKHGTRSGLWHVTAEAIRHLHPSVVVLENVRGLLTARGDEPTDELLAAWADMDRWWRVVLLIASKREKAAREGNQEYVHRHQRDWLRILGRHRRAVAAAKRADARIIRAIGTVLGTLADIGYDAVWYGLTAASVGAPHGRYRVFLIAYPNRVGHERSGRTWGRRDGSANNRGESHPDATRVGRGTEGRDDRVRTAGLVAESADSDSMGSQGPQPTPGYVVPHGGATADAVGSGLAGRARDEIGGTVRGTAPAGSGQDAATDTTGATWGGPESDDLGTPTGPTAEPRERAGAVEWGQFEPAVRRWDSVLGRPAPAPTETGAKGGQRLSPRFVEWMMGLPAGHVTDPAIGLTRNEQLKALGNGVVPNQAEAAIRYLLSAIERAA
jgi:DNA (cytosine-5)-methyltransferase 1